MAVRQAQELAGAGRKGWFETSRLGKRAGRSQADESCVKAVAASKPMDDSLGVPEMSGRVDEVLRLVDDFSYGEMQEFVARLADKLELLGWLKVAEVVFSDWDNEEDAVYDHI